MRSDRLVRQNVGVEGRTLVIVGERLDLDQIGRIAVVGTGKAGAGMAAALEQANAEADRLRIEAREYATRLAAGSVATIDAAVTKLAAAHERELDLELRALEERTAIEVSRFEQHASAERLPMLVTLVLTQLGVLMPASERSP